MVNKVLFITEFSVQPDNGDKISEFSDYMTELTVQLGKYGLLIDVFILASTDCFSPFIINGSKGVRFINLIDKAADSKGANFANLILNYILAEGLEYDIIQTDGNKWLEVGKKLKINLNIPLVCTFKDSVTSGYLSTGTKDTLQLADHLVVRQIADQNKLEKDFIINSEKISVIPFGFHTDDFYPVNKYLAKTILGVEDTDKLILHTSSIDDGKGLFNLIAALGILKRNGHTTPRLIILSDEIKADKISDSAQIARLKRLVACWDLFKNVNFIGNQHTVTLKYLYSAADLLINTSSDEHPDSIRAIACGTLVIDAVNTQISGRNRDADLGYRIHQDRPIVLAGYINQILNHSTMQEMSAEQAVFRAVSTYSWAESGKKLFRIYEGLVRIPSSLTGYPNRTEKSNAISPKFEQRLKSTFP